MVPDNNGILRLVTGKEGGKAQNRALIRKKIRQISQLFITYMEKGHQQYSERMSVTHSLTQDIVCIGAIDLCP